jgi:hypothetical protein
MDYIAIASSVFVIIAVLYAMGAKREVVEAEATMEHVMKARFRLSRELEAAQELTRRVQLHAAEEKQRRDETIRYWRDLYYKERAAEVNRVAEAERKVDDFRLQCVAAEQCSAERFIELAVAKTDAAVARADAAVAKASAADVAEVVAEWKNAYDAAIRERRRSRRSKRERLVDRPHRADLPRRGSRTGG